MSDIVGKFIKFEENEHDNLSLSTYLVIGIFKIMRTGLLEDLHVELECNNIAYVLLDINDNSFSVSYVHYFYFSSDPGITKFNTCVVDISKDDGVNNIATVIDSDLRVDEILRATSKESRLNFIRSAIKYTQWNYAKVVYGYKNTVYTKLPSYRKDMEIVLDPYFNPDKYIIKAI